MTEKMTYQERLQNAAQMHADKWNRLVEDEAAGWTDVDCIEDGKVTVAAQARVIREAVRDVCDYDNISRQLRPTIDHWTDNYLLEHGYVEPKTI